MSWTPKRGYRRDQLNCAFHKRIDVNQSLSPTLGFLLGFACLVVVLAGLRWIAPVFNQLALALISAVTALPLINWLKRKGVSNALALVITSAVTLLVLVVFVGFMAVALVIFILIASISVIVPVLYFLIAGEAAAKTLEGWKAWLQTNNATVMIVVFLVLGAMLAGNGLGGLIG